MNKPIIIEKPFGGWVPTTSGTGTTSLAASIEGNEGQYAQSTAISLFRFEKFGHIAPGEVFSAITDSSNYINQLALNGAIASTGKSFLVLRNGRVVRTGTDGTSTDAAYDITLSGSHSAHTNSPTYNPDIISIKDAQTTPVEYIISTWEDNTDADVAIIKPDGTGVSNNWFSGLGGSAGVLKAGVPLKLIQGPDGNVYITNGQYIASAVMTPGTALTAATGNKQALNLGSGYIASGLCTWKNFIVIIGHKATTYISGLSRSEVRVWFWNGFSPNPNFIFDIPDNFGAAVYNDNSTLYAFTNGRNNSNKVFTFDGTKFNLSFESTLIAAGSIPRQGSIESYQESVHIAANSKHIYQLHKGGFHDRAIATNGSAEATEIGMLKNLYQAQLFIGVTVSGPLYKVYYQNQFTQYYVNAEFRTRLYSLPYKSNITRIVVYFSQFGSGASLTTSLFKDYNTYGVGGANDLLNDVCNSTNDPRVATDLVHSISINEPDISSFYLNFKFTHSSITDTAAIIRAVVVEWEPSAKP